MKRVTYSVQIVETKTGLVKHELQAVNSSSLANIIQISVTRNLDPNEYKAQIKQEEV